MELEAKVKELLDTVESVLLSGQVETGRANQRLGMAAIYLREALNQIHDYAEEMRYARS